MPIIFCYPAHMNDIRTGIIGLTPDAIQLIRELDKNESFHLKAVAGKDH